MTPTLLAVFTPVLAVGGLAAAVGVPVIIHLLFRKRYQIVPWAAVRFLLAAVRRNRRRIDRWLLLLLRVFALLLPLLAMAATTDWAERLWQRIAPGVLETVSTAPRTHHVLVIDGSLSMTVRTHGGRTRFERAVALAEELVAAGHPGDGYTVLFLAGTVQTPVPGPSNAPEKVVKEIRRLKPTHTAADLAAALPAVVEAVARSPRAYPRRQVTVFTDAQRATWATALPGPDGTIPDGWTPILKGKDGRAPAELVVVDAAGAEVPNLAVAGLTLADPLPLVDTPAVVTATVQNFGPAERKLVRVELLLSRPSASSAGPDTPVPVAVETVDVPAAPGGGQATVRFTLDGPRSGFLARGMHVIQARLVDGDELPADDVRSLAVEVRDGVHALLVDGRKGEAEPLRRAAEHLSLALVPKDARPTDTPARLHRPGSRWPLSPSERWVLSAADFADPSVGDPTGAECLFLCDLPTVTPAVVAKLDAHLRRGGGVVIGLGPNAAAARDQYNRLLYADGTGPLPGPLGEVVTAPPNDPGYRLFADEAAYRQMPTPLAAFRDANAQAGLVEVPFRSYVRLDAPADGKARRLLSFVPAGSPGAHTPGSPKPDAAVVEWSRHRGRVVVYTSTFNREWTDWPVLPTYLPFVHELLRFAAANPDRHTVRAGEPIEEFFPAATAGLSAGLTTADGQTATLPIVLRDEAGVVRYDQTGLSGLYRLGVSEARDRVFAVNPPETSAGGTEFDLRRAEPAAFKALGPVQLVADPADVKPADDAAGAYVMTTPRPRGPDLARWALWVVLAVLAAEVVLAWRLGPARSPGAGSATGSARPPDRRPLLRVVLSVVGLVPAVVVLAAVLLVVRVEFGTEAPWLLPDSWWQAAQDGVAWLAGVPTAPPGESTRLVLERSSVAARDARADRWAVGGLGLAALVLTVAIYRRERAAAGGFRRVVVPLVLRSAVFLAVLAVLLPQWRLAFKRDGWPDVVILLDTSASMATEDDFKDPAVRAKAAELTAAAGLPHPHRLKLAQLLLTKPNADWLDRLLTEKRVKVHVYAVDTQARPVASAAEPDDAGAARAALLALQAQGDESKLGDGVTQVVKAHQGGSLAAVVMFTDGVTTAGADLPRAAEAGGVPLYLVGMGDPWVVPDLRLSDPVFEDEIAIGDTLDIRARLTARGAVPPEPVTVTLSEIVSGKKVERGRTSVVPTAAGAVVKVPFTPAEVGDKTLVLEVPTVAGEADAANNRIERRVRVTDARRVRVLFVEGDPRYDFRFVKTLLERESERVAGNKSVEFRTVLLGAGRGWPETDRSALADFPTREQLFEYDVVILGDFDPKLLPRASRALADVAEFVKVKGGGLLVVAGEHHSPSGYAETPLAEVLPVIPADGPPPKPTPEDDPLVNPYRPALTPTGRGHPLFRFSPDPVESDRVWNRLRPLFWHATGYKAKPAAEVLATHPERAGGAGRQPHPLVLQQFVGAGRVLFLGFDETWRWRFRADEEQFNRFWMQAVRLLARSRRGKTELRLEPGGGVYRRGDRLTVKVRFPDDAPPPPDDASVRVRVKRLPLANPDGSAAPGEAVTEELKLSRVKTERAEFEAVLTRTPEGEYRFTVSDGDGGASPASAEARVLPPPSERERVDLNRADLVAAAERSHGKFYTPADADKLFDDLHGLEPVPLNEPRPPLPLWNDPAVWGVLVLVLTAEWLLRKRERLL